MSASMWAREVEFKALLHKAVMKASRSAIEELTDLAVADETWVWLVLTCHALDCLQAQIMAD